MSAHKLKKVSCDLEELFRKIVVVGSAPSYGRSGQYLCDWDGVSTFVKFAPYYLIYTHHWSETVPGTHPVDMEIRIMRLLKERVLDKGYTPHIVEIYDAVVCDEISASFVKECESMASNIPSLNKHDALRPICNHYEATLSGHNSKKYALIFSEPCSIPIFTLLNNLPFDKFEKVAVVRAMLFQIIYTIEVIKRVFPTFKHHDLHLGNILVATGPERVDPYKPKYIRYTIDSRTFNVPYRGYILKIIDFGLSELPEEGLTNIDSIAAIPKENLHGKVVRNYWEEFDDLVRFVLEMTTTLQTDSSMNALLSDLNPAMLQFSSTPRILVQHQESIRSMLDAIFTADIFKPLMITVDDSNVIAQYKAPDKCSN